MLLRVLTCHTSSCVRKPPCSQQGGSTSRSSPVLVNHLLSFRANLQSCNIPCTKVMLWLYSHQPWMQTTARHRCGTGSPDLLGKWGDEFKTYESLPPFTMTSQPADPGWAWATTRALDSQPTACSATALRDTRSFWRRRGKWIFCQSWTRITSWTMVEMETQVLHVCYKWCLYSFPSLSSFYSPQYLTTT